MCNSKRLAGGIGGLAVASVALKHFDSVTICDKDDLTGRKVLDESILEVNPRSCLPKANPSVHIFLKISHSKRNNSYVRL